MGTALVAGDLVTTLSGGGPSTFIVFAPTNDAFKALGTKSYMYDDGSISAESMLKPQNKEQLVDILKNHVVPKGSFRKVYPTGPHPAEPWSAETLLDSNLHPHWIGGHPHCHVGVRSPDPRRPDGWSGPEFSLPTGIEAFNGVVFVIDGLLLPAKEQSATVVV